MSVYEQDSPGPSASSGAVIELGSLLRQGVTLQPERTAVLKDSLAKGLAFFDRYNESRLQLAFRYFDQPMREAVFEIVYLLHNNTPALAKLSCMPSGDKGPDRAAKEEFFNLFVEGCPAGVAGADRLSRVFRQDFLEYTQKVFGSPPAPLNGTRPAVVTLQSIGSIGTVGHKSGDSDLDLQVTYNLTAPPPDASHWNNAAFREVMAQELAWWVANLPALQKIPPEKANDAAMQQQLRVKAERQIATQYPNLYAYLWKQSRRLGDDVASAQGGVLRTQVLQELVALVKRNAAVSNEAQTRKMESSLKARIAKIERYVEKRFPAAEIHLFPNPIVGFRLGRHISTIELKESSGSAYELLLNYETLLPGIHLTPMVPAHFIFPPFVNNDAALYARLMDYIAFDLIDVYREAKATLVDLGHTPNVEARYVAQHSGAVYWEAFKASSGNLPKAALNLLRYEMLLEPKLLKTNIQLIKEPAALDGLADAKGERAKSELELLKLDGAGLPGWAVLELESAFAHLCQDPWWLRYKALKLGFGEERGVSGLDKEERRFVSRVTDLAFALHVRISDVFTKPGDMRPLDSPRERALAAYLQQAFPSGSERRGALEQIFIGETDKVNQFEHDLRSIFKRSMARVEKKVAAFNLPDRGRKREEELWYEYYLTNFDPMPNVVLRTIMHHLRVPRGRVQLGYKPGEGWFFRSLQKESSVGKRFDTFGLLNHLPEEVLLLDKSAFLPGIAHCILNGYLGIAGKGTLRERRTALEFDGKHMDMHNKVDNTLAYLRPDMVHRIVDRVAAFFPPQYPDYKDYIAKPRRITAIMAFLNLWHYGQLALLYRDNLNTWYCDEIEHPTVLHSAQSLSRSPAAMLAAKPIHETFGLFLKGKKISLDDAAFAAWVNPNSVATSHAAGQEAAKERQLAAEFEQLVRKLHARGGASASPKSP